MTGEILYYAPFQWRPLHLCILLLILCQTENGADEVIVHYCTTIAHGFTVTVHPFAVKVHSFTVEVHSFVLNL